ncbi:MAG TPA: hypothetical protein VLJ16_06010, partial [Acidobacteriota bacterium]|nr:hypothetical protein [Acidobacteriota bacterium]
SYLKHDRKTLESAKRRSWVGRFRGSFADFVQRAVLWSPEERAVGAFFSKTIRSSPKHRAVLINSLGVGAALVMLAVVASRRNVQALTPGNTTFLAQSLLLVFILLAGLRIVVDVPAALDSNWVFRVTETDARPRYVRGLKKTIFVQWLLPLSGLIFLAHLWLWKDGRAALFHAVFCLSVSGLGLEALFFRFRKIPFASTYVPGKLRLQTRVIPYLLGFLALLAALAGLEKALLGHPARFVIFLAAAVALSIVLDLRSVRSLKDNPLIYEEEPEPAMIGFPEDV